MTLAQILADNNAIIRQKVLENSISTDDEATRLDVIAKYAAKAYPRVCIVIDSPAIAGGSRVYHLDFENEDIATISGTNFILFSASGPYEPSDFTKNIADPFVDFPAGVLAVGSRVSVQIKGV